MTISLFVLRSLSLKGVFFSSLRFMSSWKQIKGECLLFFAIFCHILTLTLFFRLEPRLWGELFPTVNSIYNKKAAMVLILSVTINWFLFIFSLYCMFLFFSFPYWQLLEIVIKFEDYTVLADYTVWNSIHV